MSHPDVGSKRLRPSGHKYKQIFHSETLRIYLPATFTIRKNPSDLKVGDYILPAKSSLFINIYGIHHNPTVFENPEVFDPDRFLPEHCEKRHPFAFIPFFGSPRNCIGQRFAMMEMKTVLANVLRNFRVKSLDHRDKIFESLDVILHPKFDSYRYDNPRCKSIYMVSLARKSLC
ncbi:cytochrome P450 4C1-like [Centruroides vittatus]|uniref:cytochrome P450 4C1-like n=1 Tax=Centruroides vittatus TaxID=120091 RepID=UPI00350F8E29